MKVLAIQSSLRGNGGASSRMLERFVTGWRERRPEDCIERLDLAQDPLPHLDGDTFACFAVPAAERDPKQVERLRRSEQLIAQLAEAEALVLGVPMYNKFVPSTFKSWIDHVARSGRTFRYTAAGPIGLLADRPTWILTSRGGFYRGTAGDLHTPWLQQIFALMGITDLRFVYAEGLNVSPQVAADSLARAEHEIDQLLSNLSLPETTE